MKRLSLVFTAGFAMFSMFFGSGNLVFPITVGVKSLHHFGYATLGLLLTGILVPFLGMLSMITADADRPIFFSQIGRIPSFLLTFLMVALLGPFGVCARCILVSYQGIATVFPSIPNWLFGLFFCFLTASLSWHRNQIIAILGKYLTPFLLAGIALLIAFGMYRAEPSLQLETLPKQAFFEGFLQGYQTMDLLAAFFFSTTIVRYLKFQLNTKESEPAVIRLALESGGFGVLLLGAVYTGFVYLGAAYAPYIAHAHPAERITLIAELALGPLAKPLISITIALACLTTIVAVANLFAEFLSQEIFQGKLQHKSALLLTLTISFFVSLAGFTRLAQGLASILEYVYPALIALALGKIAEKTFKQPTRRLVPALFYSTLVFSVAWKYLPF